MRHVRELNRQPAVSCIRKLALLISDFDHERQRFASCRYGGVERDADAARVNTAAIGGRAGGIVVVGRRVDASERAGAIELGVDVRDEFPQVLAALDGLPVALVQPGCVERVVLNAIVATTLTAPRPVRV